MKRKSKKVSIDEAAEIKGKLGLSKKDFHEKVSGLQDERFTQLRSGIVFAWKKQPNGKQKLMGRLPNGKVLFLDWSEDEKDIKIDVPYICVIYEPEENPDGSKARQAYARIVCEEYMPKIIIKPGGIVYMVWKDQKGNTRRTMASPNKSFVLRLADAVKEMEKKGYEEVRLIYYKNKK